jgi:hypothetical protein
VIFCNEDLSAWLWSPKQHGSSNRQNKSNLEICLGPEAEDKRGREHATLFYFDRKDAMTL